MKCLVVSHFIIFIVCLNVWVNTCTGINVKKSVDNNEDTGESSDEDEKEESLAIPANEIANITCTRRSNSLLHEIRSARPRQFPFMAAAMSAHDDYLCSGAVVSNGMVLTTAKCTHRAVSYVLLNTTTDKNNPNAVMLQVTAVERFPTFDPKSNSLKNVGIIYIQKHNGSIASKIKLSSLTNDRSIHDVEAIGFGLNSDVGQPKELQYVGLEVRSPLENNYIINAYFDCIDTKVPTCFKDTGGPAIIDNELIGIVTTGQEVCTTEMSSMYVMNKKMAEIIPIFTFRAWLNEKISMNEMQNQDKLSIFPLEPSRRFLTPKTTRKTTTTTTTTTATPEPTPDEEMFRAESEKPKSSARSMAALEVLIVSILIILSFF